MSNSLNILALFPGQGSQAVGMGREIFEESEVARDVFERVDRALGFALSSLCFSGPLEELTKTDIAQPAILTSSIAHFLAAKSECFTKKSPFLFQCGAGHSLGEYSALVAAEALSLEDAVVLVNKRGRYMQEAVPIGLGAMFAALGAEVREIEDALSKLTQEDFGPLEIANINAPGQIVLAGTAKALARFREMNPSIKGKELTVSAPFHCSLMRPAQEKLAKDIATLSLSTPKFPIISNYYAKPLKTVAEIKKALELQVCGRVRWVESMEYASKEFEPTKAIEFGGGKVLAGLMKRIDRELEVIPVSSPQEVNELCLS